VSSERAPDPTPEPVERVSTDDRPGTFRRWGSRGTAIVLALGAVVLVLIGATLGLALSSSSDHTSDSSMPTSSSLVVPGPDSVDVGFAQDMIVHHSQGVLMAHYAELDTEDPEIGLMAYDINYTQTAQIGQMQGWLALWGYPQISGKPHMWWMTDPRSSEAGHAGHDMGGMDLDSAVPSSAATAGTNPGSTETDPTETALMPGMATPAEMDKLKSLHGKESDIYFLQLMIRHHQGGAAMMAYAEKYATNPVVQNFAGKMLVAQTGEIQTMTDMLKQRGAEPLPFTAPAMPTG
jgi:uncharacterized protein (DUF305 family)